MTPAPRSVLRVLVLALAVVTAGAALAQSQATTGVIEGIVSDTGGVPLPGVAVAIRNTATNFEKSTVTGPDGRFRGLALPLGPYRVTASLKGFSTLVREGLDLDGRADDQPHGSRPEALDQDRGRHGDGGRAGHRDDADGGLGPDRQRRRSRASRTTAATSSTSRS